MLREGTIFLARPWTLLGWHVAMFGTYEPELRQVFKIVLQPGYVAIDVGANIGWHTLLMARQVESHGRVLAVEPNRSVCARLRANIDINRFSHVEIVPWALADRPGALAFFEPDDSGGGHAVRDAVASPDTITVEARRLDDIVADARIDRVDLIKIDVEGFEWPVLLGAEDLIGRFRPHIVFEYDPTYVSYGGGSAASLDEFFRRHRYRLYALGRNWSEAVSTGRWPVVANIWAIPEADK